MDDSVILFNKSQLAQLEQAFQTSAAHASDAMSRWLSVPSLLTIESIEQLPLEEAAGVLGDEEDLLCFCTMVMTGTLTGSIVLTFNDENGLSLSDLLLDRPVGSAEEWSEIEQSAAIESTNIICTNFLNALATCFPESAGVTLIPAPPVFNRDFAESQLQFMYMDQAMTTNTIFLVQARFEIRGEPLNWTLLFIPDKKSVAVLRDLLPESTEA